jgi:hypothetical protein
MIPDTQTGRDLFWFRHACSIIGEKVGVTLVVVVV